MFFCTAAIDDYIVNIDETAHADKSMQDSVHCLLENNLGIRQANRNAFEFDRSVKLPAIDAEPA